MNIEEENAAKLEARKIAKNKYHREYYHRRMQLSEDFRQNLREQANVRYNIKKAALEAEAGFIKKGRGRPRKYLAES
jgi:ribosomal protein L32E